MRYVCLAFITLALGISSLAIAEEYRRILKNMPISLDPPEFDDINAAQVMIQVGEGLTAFDGNTLRPAIASRWEISPDFLEYTFHLNPEAKFSDGKPITASAVVQALEHLLKVKSLSLQELSVIHGVSEFHNGTAPSVSGLKIVSPASLKMVLDRPFPPLLGILASPTYSILPKESLDILAAQKVAPFVSSGPYVLTEVEKGKFLRFKKNPHYYASSEVFYDTLSYEVVQNKEAAIQGFISGKYHDIWPFHAEALPSDFARGVTSIPSLTAFTWYLELNLQQKKFADLQFRKLISQSLDVEGFLKEMKLPQSYQAFGYIPKGMLGYRSSPRAEAPAPDSTLAKVGCTSAKPCEFDVLFTHDVESALSALFRPLARFAPALRLKYSKVTREDWFKRLSQRKFDIGYLGFTVDHHETYFVLRYLLNDGYLAGIPVKKRQEMSAKMEQALEAADKTKRAELYSEIDSLLYDQHVFLPIYHGDIPFRQVRKDIEGYSHSILGYPYLSIKKLHPVAGTGTKKPEKFAD